MKQTKLCPESIVSIDYKKRFVLSLTNRMRRKGTNVFLHSLSGKSKTMGALVGL